MFIVEDQNECRTFPYLTFAIIILNVALFAFSISDLDGNIFRFGFKPGAPRVFSMFTAMFLHGSLAHLLGNMYFLYIFGDNVEDALGPILFLMLFILAGLTGSLLHGLTHPGSLVPAVGASGAISGLIGAYIAIHPHAKLNIFYSISFLRLEYFRLTAFTFAIVWVIINLALGVITSKHGYHVAFMAHVGGFLVGYLSALLFLSSGSIEDSQQRTSIGYSEHTELGPEKVGVTTTDFAAKSLFAMCFIGFWAFLFSRRYREKTVDIWVRQLSNVFLWPLLMFEISTMVFVGCILPAVIIMGIFYPADTKLALRSIRQGVVSVVRQITPE